MDLKYVKWYPGIDSFTEFFHKELELTGNHDTRVDCGDLLTKYHRFCLNRGLIAAKTRTLDKHLKASGAITRSSRIDGGPRKQLYSGVRWQEGCGKTLARQPKGRRKREGEKVCYKRRPSTPEEWIEHPGDPSNGFYAAVTLKLGLSYHTLTFPKVIIPPPWGSEEEEGTEEDMKAIKGMEKDEEDHCRREVYEEEGSDAHPRNVIPSPRGSEGIEEDVKKKKGKEKEVGDSQDKKEVVHKQERSDVHPRTDNQNLDQPLLESINLLESKYNHPAVSWLLEVEVEAALWRNTQCKADHDGHKERVRYIVAFHNIWRAMVMSYTPLKPLVAGKSRRHTEKIVSIYFKFLEKAKFCMALAIWKTLGLVKGMRRRERLVAFLFSKILKWKEAAECSMLGEGTEKGEEEDSTTHYSSDNSDNDNDDWSTDGIAENELDTTQESDQENEGFGCTSDIDVYKSFIKDLKPDTWEAPALISTSDTYEDVAFGSSGVLSDTHRETVFGSRGQASCTYGYTVCGSSKSAPATYGDSVLDSSAGIGGTPDRLREDESRDSSMMHTDSSSSDLDSEDCPENLDKWGIDREDYMERAEWLVRQVLWLKLLPHLVRVTMGRSLLTPDLRNILLRNVSPEEWVAFCSNKEFRAATRHLAWLRQTEIIKWQHNGGNKTGT